MVLIPLRHGGNQCAHRPAAVVRYAYSFRAQGEIDRRQRRAAARTIVGGSEPRQANPDQANLPKHLVRV